MNTLALLSLGLAVAMAMPPLPPGVAQSPDFTKEEQSPLVGDLVPLQGHVVVEHLAPQARLDSKEQEEKMSPVSVDMEQTEGQRMVELEAKVKSDARVEQELKVEPEVQPEVVVEQELKVEPEVQPEVVVEQELKVEPEVQPEVEVQQELKVEPEVQPEVVVEQLKTELKVKVAPEENLNPEVKEDLEMNLKSEVEMESDVQKETEPEDTAFEQEVQEEFSTLMNLDAEAETSQEVQERHGDEMRTYEVVGDPVMELEPLEKVSDMKLFEALPEDRGLMKKGRDVLHEQPIMELEPELKTVPIQNQEIMPEAASMEEGPALDFMGNPIQSLEEYFPNEEARVAIELSNQEHSLTVDRMRPAMMEEPGREESPGAEMQEPAVENSPVLDEATRQSYCSGVILEGKCYQFFEGPKKAEDAEFFCQNNFPGGHLASITSQHIHREVMSMMLRQNGAHTRTWIGGLRYLNTGHFIWLDGSHWGYADWLRGEPNNTAGVEACLEVLSFGNGKFNDFTCWEPQAFICSYRYQ